MADLSPEIQERIVALVHQVCDLRKITGMESPYAHAVYLAERLFHEIPKPVDPDLIEAREICADHFTLIYRDVHGAASARRGELDHSDLIQVALVAIRRTALAKAQGGAK